MLTEARLWLRPLGVLSKYWQYYLPHPLRNVLLLYVNCT